jgi:superfamily II DNA/RNA helicase
MTDAFKAADDSLSVEDFPINSSDASTDALEPAELIEAIPNGFLAFGLAPELIRAVQDLGFTQPTTVQHKTIPLAMEGVDGVQPGTRFVDLMVSSQTGSGKTAAFLLPVLQTKYPPVPYYWFQISR